MGFLVKPRIELYASLKDFIKQKELGKQDLIVTNEYVLLPQLDGAELPCDVMYQEKYGQGEPYDDMVEAMLTDIQGKGYERIIPIGGGSVIDISKLFVFGDGYNLEEIYAQGATLEKKRELIAVPTTCGTGSEVTNIAIVEFKKKQTKFGLAVSQLFADEAALIPTMLETLPLNVFAASSIDAFIHAVESYVSPKATEFSRMFGKTAMEKIVRGYKKIKDSGERRMPDDLEDFMVASTMAGISFLNAGCAAVHALSFPIGANYHVPHGEAVYMMFEEVFNMYKELGADISPAEEVLAEVLACDIANVWKEFFALLDFMLPRKKLREFGTDEAKCEEMAKSAFMNQQRLLVNNPIAFTQEHIKAIYMRCI